MLMRSGAGLTTLRSSFLRACTSTMRQSRCTPFSKPARKPAISSKGATVALRPQREVGSALVLREGVHLVHDAPFRVREVAAELRGVEEDGKALGRRDEDVRWLLRHLGALRRRR